MTTKTYISYSPLETEEIAKGLAKNLKSGDFIAFFGGLGMGKTNFVRGLASVLCPDVRVTSPTFALVNEYIGNLNIYHFDMYRIKDSDDLYSTGFYEYLERPGIVAAEWCEMIPDDLPENRYDVTFERLSENERKITIQKIG
ncbi:MAG: tRNA (adenosine(37)-N6)-threonylcarbamoyltransferase complex ATPase subunit type 1 TsaE [Clostridia bacterium]|nr:tRNA (adenosine(37)-N6)-threonylcarbamoyltransferase complex ATPase subunit type 1 TsaE [Clostridia bacterium]